MTYTITAGDTANAFSIGSSSGRGIISVPDISALSAGTYNLTITATDTAGNTDMQTVAVTVVGSAFSLSSGAANGTSVGIVGSFLAPSGGGENDRKYTITAGDASNAFAIGLTSGEITVADSSALTAASYTLTVTETIVAGTSTTTPTKTVTVNIN